jgi:peptide-methionine (S)-S-oxide reductase
MPRNRGAVKTGCFRGESGGSAGPILGARKDSYNNSASNGVILVAMSETKIETTQVATFAAGCFWGIEAAFRQLPGVLDVTSGYEGGHTTNPSYRDVCSDRTGHAEVVQVTFDPARIGYDRLLEEFWTLHDPTTPNRQGPDVGSQYRSAIFYHSEDQRAQAEASKAREDAGGKHRRAVVTEIVPAQRFYPAEDYHQRYFEKNGIACHR